MRLRIPPGTDYKKLQKHPVFNMTKNLLSLIIITLAVDLATVLNSDPVQALQFSYSGVLSGANESPSNASLGTGTTQVTYDDIAHSLRVQVTFSGLTGNTTAAHIHGPTATAGIGTAGVITTTPTFAGFPTGVTSGSYDNTLDLTLNSSYNASFITANGGTTSGAETALAASLAAGKSYLNIHTTAFPGGEIRSFLTPVVAVPFEFSPTLGFFIVGAGFGVNRLIKRKK
jgi:CHRD domain